MGALALTPSTSAKDNAMYTEFGINKHADSFVTTIGSVTREDHISSRIGLSIMHNSGFEEATYLGLNGGVRVYTHNDFTPFAGIGAFTGYHEKKVLTDDDGFDNNNDGTIDECRESETEYDFIIGVYPEAGLRYKINRRTSITASAQYHVTSEGSEHNFWSYNLGCQFSF
jgi:hypothetical protein